MLAEADWSKEHLDEFLVRLTEALPKEDTAKYSTQADKVDWNGVKFGDYNAEECRAKWIDISTKVGIWI